MEGEKLCLFQIPQTQLAHVFVSPRLADNVSFCWPVEAPQVVVSLGI